MPYLLPEDLDPDVFKCLTIRIPDDPQWEVNFWGAALELAKWFNHDRDALHKGKIVADKWRGWIDEAMACNTITGITIVNSKLLVQFCNSDVWVTVGPVSSIPMRYVNGRMEYDIDGDGTFEVSQYINTQQNLYGPGLPVTDDNDRFCRAAWIMANVMADDYKDAMKVVRGVISSIVKGAQWLSSWLGYALFPETVELLAGGTTETVIDWMDSAAKEPESIKKAAQLLYCAIKEAYPDNLDNLFDYIDLGVYDPEAYFDPATRLVPWTNFSDLSNLVYSTLQQEQTAYLSIAFAKISIKLGIANLGFFSPVQAMMEYALATAEHFDSRDCGDFPCQVWEHIFDFADGEQGWIPATVDNLSPLSSWGGSYWYQVNPLAERYINMIFREFPYPSYITEVEVFYDSDWEGFNTGVQTYTGPVGDRDPIIHYSGTGLSGRNLSFLASVEETVDNIMVQVGANDDIDSNPGFKILKVIFRGTGENPFD